MDEDPVFFERFGKLVKDAIDAYRQKRLDDAAYLQHVLQLRDQVVNGDRADVPESVRYDGEARAVFGVVKDVVRPEYFASPQALDQFSAEAAHAITGIVERRRTVNWTRNQDVQNQMKNDIEDYLYQFERRGGPKLSPDELDNLLDRSLTIARRRGG
jgi:type I restriction enzyme R subunit